MQLVFSAPDKMLVGHVRNLLEAEGIACTLKNEFLVGAAGELPLNEVWPEVWLENDVDYQHARAVIAALISGDADETAAPWTCAHCGEILEGQFVACWRCGHVRQDHE